MDQVSRDRRQLARQFPLCFSAMGSNQQKKPLKYDLHFDIAQRGLFDKDGFPVSMDRIIKALARYKNGPHYARAVAAGGQTFDLDGKPYGVVSPAMRERYRLKLISMGWVEPAKRVAA